ncbi:cholesterol 7-desaturase nvd [Condylostylus longicornis]|uniref:cholesterol 7-desaturase nvd n=1 Tax=Condylostylus longicornis TaxID=2530218 RepID=UPI00244E3E25|nr:cholesterol 7-desaturase nvd [Condylostylus longicornis]
MEYKKCNQSKRDDYFEISYNFAVKNIKNKNNVKKRDIINRIRRLRKISMDKSIPPPFPNGWYAIEESKNVAVGQAISVSCLGEQFVVFRSTTNMQIFVLDAYCPHMGANLGIGGVVIGEKIQCPFHHWSFNGTNGECSNIPYSSCKPKSIKIKKWVAKECNDYIFVWYSKEDCENLQWDLPIIDEIESKRFVYHGRNEFLVNCHIQDIPENGADLAHFSAIHGDSLIAGNQPQFKWSACLGHHNWNAIWLPETETKHLSKIFLQHSMRLFGKIDICSMDVSGNQIGPAFVVLHINTAFGSIIITQVVTPIEPLTQKVVHRFYGSRLSAPFMKFLIFAESVMFERDMNIWNHKTFVNSPCLVKEDRLIKSYRNWFGQFYSSNSKTFKEAYESSEW